MLKNPAYSLIEKIRESIFLLYLGLLETFSVQETKIILPINLIFSSAFNTGQFVKINYSQVLPNYWLSPFEMELKAPSLNIS